jgi:hypothetical protein
MNYIDQLIKKLIANHKLANGLELQKIITHVAQAPFSSRLVKINRWLRRELSSRGVEVPRGKQPSIEVHLLKRIYFDGQWLPHTTVTQFTNDLHLAVQHSNVQIWTYRWLGESFAGFLSPSHVQNVPNPEAFIFVAYSADYSTIKTGFQASSAEAIFTEAFEDLTRHK